MAKNNQGGKREGAGRKSLSEDKLRSERLVIKCTNEEKQQILNILKKIKDEKEGTVYNSEIILEFLKKGCIFFKRGI